MIKKVYDNIAHTRENVLSSVINHLLKKYNKELTYDELLTHSSNIISQFPVKKKLLDKTLETMIENNYINKLSFDEMVPSVKPVFVYKKCLY